MLCVWFLLVVNTSASDCLERLVSEMTYYMSRGTLNCTYSVTPSSPSLMETLTLSSLCYNSTAADCLSVGYNVALPVMLHLFCYFVVFLSFPSLCFILWWDVLSCDLHEVTGWDVLLLSFVVWVSVLGRSCSVLVICVSSSQRQHCHNHRLGRLLGSQTFPPGHSPLGHSLGQFPLRKCPTLDCC